MQLGRRGWDIHAVSAEPRRAGGRITSHSSVLGAQEHQAVAAAMVKNMQEAQRA